MAAKLRASSSSIRCCGIISVGLRPVALLRVELLEEVADVDAQRLGDLVEPSGGNPVDAGLVLVRLLVGDADQLGHLLLREPQHDPPLADPQAHIMVDVEGPASTRRSAGDGLDAADELVIDCYP